MSKEQKLSLIVYQGLNKRLNTLNLSKTREGVSFEEERVSVIMNVLGLNSLKCFKVRKLFLNLLFPLFYLLQVSRNLPLVSLLYLHDYLLPPLGGQLK